MFGGSKTLNDVEREYIIQILEETGWKIAGTNGAANILGINPSTLRSRLNKLGIIKPKSSIRSS
jgi:transcriptional regulator with GAF, ATPase, and Fis domain